MRGSLHNGRINKCAKHNDRNFDTAKADHIDPARAANNMFSNWTNDNSITFEESEIRFYKEYLQGALDARNNNYIKARHKDKVIDMDAFRKSKKSMPEEVILQIGDKDAHPDAEILKDCAAEYIDWMQRQYPQLKTLNTALHVDEATPHVQLRRVWTYTDTDGVLKVGQEKALEQMGVSLPEPDKKVGRYNNRKITFDKACRTRWLGILKAHNLEIEEIPLPPRKHIAKNDFILQKQEQQLVTNQDKIDRLDAQIRSKEDRLKRCTKLVMQNEKRLKTQNTTLDDVENQLKSVSEQVKTKNQELELMNSSIASAELLQQTYISQNKELEFHKTELVEQICNLQKDKAAAKEEINFFESKIAELKKITDSHKSMISGFESEIEERKLKIAYLDKRIENINSFASSEAQLEYNDFKSNLKMVERTFKTIESGRSSEVMLQTLRENISAASKSGKQISAILNKPKL